MDRRVLAVLAELAQPTAGCISNARLRDAGISARRAQSLRDRSALLPIVRGVMLFGSQALSREAAVHAALLRAGPNACLGGRTALEWRALLGDQPQTTMVATPRTRTGHDILLTTAVPLAATGRPGTLRLRRARGSVCAGAELVRGVRTCSVVIGLLDLAARDAGYDLARAWREADFRGLLSVGEVEAALHRSPPGADRIRSMLRRHPVVGQDRRLLSRAEQRFLAGLERRGLAPTSVNEPAEIAAGIRIAFDAWFARERVAFEVDGGGHDRPVRQEADAERDRLALQHGVTVVRFSDTEVWRQLEACLDEAAATLAARRPTRGARSRRP